MPIKLEDHMTWPRLDSVWSHHNGNMYVVRDYANVETDRQDDYPTTILYRNMATGKLYCRKLIDWERSMVLVRE